MKQINSQTFIAELSSKVGHLRQPEGAMFELTYGCNLRCVHCYNPTHRSMPHELTTKEVCSIISQMADLGMLTVTFSGGEPLLRPDIEVILRHTRQVGLLAQLLTNATRMTPTFANMLERVGISQLFISIYGVTAETYERMTGIQGSFPHFLRGLSCLTARSFPVTVRMPMTTINMHELDACQDLAESSAFKFQYCLDIHPRTDGDVSPLQYRLDPADKAHLDHRKLGKELAAWVPDACSPNEPFVSCACGHSRFAVTPYGEMNLCVAFPTPKYDLRAGTVIEGWEVLKQTVDAASPNAHYDCPTCDVNRFCRQGRSDAWLETGDMSRCLPHFKEWAQSLEATHALLDPRQPR